MYMCVYYLLFLKMFRNLNLNVRNLQFSKLELFYIQHIA
jgi:hypothetical protein